MESIGERLKSIREAKKMTIREVAKETNISSLYIEALENEDFDKFPGETYVIGFIRSYSEYLKIDSEEIIQSYKGYKIGESVTPLEELTKPTSSGVNVDFADAINKLRPIFMIIVIIAVVGGLGFGAFKLLSGRRININGNDSIEDIKTAHDQANKQDFTKIINLKLANDSGNELVYVNEALQFMSDTKECIFVLRKIENGTASIEILPNKTTKILQENVPQQIDFPGSPRDITVTLNATTPNRARFKVDLAKSENLVVNDSGAEEEDKNISTTQEVQNTANLKITFEARFTAKTYIEIYLDGQQKARGIMQPKSYEKWEANEFIQVKIGNAGGVNAKINGEDYKFGLPGQIANKVITWKKDPTNPNKYSIVVKEW